MNHTDLCRLTAEKFVKTFALYEVRGRWENPDVITFNSCGKSWVYEIKMSRSDFISDFKKNCRKDDKKKAGDHHAYVCYGNFINKEEIPNNWGLYHYINGKFKCIKDIPSTFDFSPFKDWNLENEILINYIITNRFFNNGRIVFNKRYCSNSSM